LLNRRQIQRVPWAAMRFLQVSIENNQRRLQVEDLLLLLLRVLLIALIAFALARPALRAAGGLLGQPASSTLIVIDNSYSMTQTSGVASRLDVAKRAALQIVDSLPSGSSVAIWTAGDSVTPLIPEPTRDMSMVRTTINNTTASDRATDMRFAVESGIRMLKQSKGASKEIYIITDGQKAGFRQLAAMQQQLDSVKQDLKATFVMVDQPESGNLAVSSLVQASGVAAIDRPLRFSAVVTNYGDQPAKEIRVSLKLSSTDATDRATAVDAPVDDATIDTIEPGMSKAVSLFGRLKSDGYYAVTASLAPDRVPADDSRTIVVRGTKRVKVLLVDGDTGREARDSETFFLRAVFAASGSAGQPPLIEATVTEPGSVQAENLEAYDAIVLANVPELTAAAAEGLNTYVTRGGGLLIFPGARVSPAFYNDTLSAKYNLLPATYGPGMGEEKSQSRTTTFSDSALDHPIATLWKDPASGRLSSASIYRYLPLILVPAKDRSGQAPKAVLKLVDGTPAVVEKAHGEGRVIMFNTTADSAWNDLPARPGVFVPLLYRSVGSIVEKRDESLNITVGQKFVYKVGLDLLGKEAEIRYMNGDPNAIPDSRRIALGEGDVATLVSEPTEHAGAYRVRINDQSPLLFAAQTDVSESNLQPASREDMDKLAKSARVLPCKIDTDLAAGLKQERTGTELIFPLAVLLLILGVTESALAMWFSRSK
jgi:hypothetical protein